MIQDDRSKERAETARRHDDSDLIEDNLETPSQGGRSGGNLATDVATQAAEERVSDPDAHEGVDKQDDINHAQRYAADKRPDNRE